MPKGYWIASLDVTDVDTYKTYVQANAEAFAKYKAKFLTRGGPFTQLEGHNRSRNVILEFESVDQALDCYYSPEYQKALSIRAPVAHADIIIMEGYDGPQPPEQPGEKASVRSADGGSFRSIKQAIGPRQYQHMAVLSDGTVLTQQQYDYLSAATEANS